MSSAVSLSKRPSWWATFVAEFVIPELGYFIATHHYRVRLDRPFDSAEAQINNRREVAIVLLDRLDFLQEPAHFRELCLPIPLGSIPCSGVGRPRP